MNVRVIVPDVIHYDEVWLSESLIDSNVCKSEISL